MTAIGFTWFFQGPGGLGHQRRLRRSGPIGLTLPFAILIHLLVSFPSGRLEDRLQRALVGVAYFVTIVMQVAWIARSPTRRGKAAKAARSKPDPDCRPRGARGSDQHGRRG